MTQTTEQRRTIEARLDRLKERLKPHRLSSPDNRELTGVLKGVLDLLTDVLLEDDR